MNRAIAAVHTKEAGTLTAGLYVDCSGFRARLISEALGSPFKSMSDVLFVDSALAMQVPCEARCADRVVHDRQRAGPRLDRDIGLQERRGTVTPTAAGNATTTRRNARCGATSARRRRADAAQARAQHRYRESAGEEPLAVGLSGGFLEPLESSGIGLTETAAYLIGQLVPVQRGHSAGGEHFNAFTKERYARIVDFISCTTD